jgi:hypothetical protein
MVLGGIILFIAALFGSMAGPRGSGVIGIMGTVMGLFILGMALLVFFPALYLARYASRIAQLRGSGRVEDLEAALEAQKSYWKFIGILTVIWLVFYFVMMLLQIIGVAMM